MFLSINVNGGIVTVMFYSLLTIETTALKKTHFNTYYTLNFNNQSINSNNILQ